MDMLGPRDAPDCPKEEPRPQHLAGLLVGLKWHRNRRRGDEREQEGAVQGARQAPWPRRDGGVGGERAQAHSEGDGEAGSAWLDSLPTLLQRGRGLTPGRSIQPGPRRRLGQGALGGTPRPDTWHRWSPQTRVLSWDVPEDAPRAQGPGEGGGRGQARGTWGHLAAWPSGSPSG